MADKKLSVGFSRKRSVHPSNEDLQPSDPPPVLPVAKKVKKTSSFLSSHTIRHTHPGHGGLLAQTTRSAASLELEDEDITERFEGDRLAQKLNKKKAKPRRQDNLAALEEKNLVKQIHLGTAKPGARITLFYRRWQCVFTGNLLYRHPYRIITFFEVVFPFLFALLIFVAFTSGISWRLAYYERKSSEKHHPHFDDIEGRDLGKAFIKKIGDAYGRFLLVYTPNNNFTQGIVKDSIQWLKIGHQNQFHFNHGAVFGTLGVNSQAELIEMCMLHRRDQKLHKSPIGVTFIYEPDQVSNYTGLPNKLTFAISTFDPTIEPTSEPHPHVDPPKSANWDAPYVKSGFLGLQFAIERAYIETVSAKLAASILENVKLNATDVFDPKDMKKSIDFIRSFIRNTNQLPRRVLKMIYFPNFVSLRMRALMKFVICLTLVFGYSGLSYFIVKQIVKEHVSGIKDLLTIHNLPNYTHWIVLLGHALLFRTITAMLVTSTFFIDFSRGPVLQHSNSFVVFVFIWIQLLAHTASNFFLGTLLNDVALSGFYSICLSFLSFIIPLTIWNAGLLGQELDIAFSVLLPNWALTNGISQIVEYDSEGHGIDWDNFINYENKIPRNMSFTLASQILVGSCVVYFILAVFEDQGREKKLSTGLKWYHFIKRCRAALHQRKHRKEIKQHESLESGDNDKGHYDKPPIYEYFSESYKRIVKVRNLTKVYGKHKVVLDNINMDFREGEIIVLLGHGSSGKSSLLLSLAGVITPTKGFATIEGYNVVTQVQKARQFMGLCPQEPIVFNLLSVMNHLVLCYRLRGLSRKDAYLQAEDLLHLLRLDKVRNRRPNSLTTNEQRKLTIAMCLVGNPAVILLDEPTSKMDSLARREIWEILKFLKNEGHTIIVSTTMMDEAEHLADRVALLDHGKLICYGTPHFLKAQYDTGFVLKVVPLKQKFSRANLESLAEKHMGQKLKETKKKAMSERQNVLFELPKAKVAYFANFLDAIESVKSKLGILHYEVHRITLCDIFIKICESAGAEEIAPDVYMRRNSGEDWATGLAQHIPSIPPEENFRPTALHNFYALCFKRWICTKTLHKSAFWQFVLPFLLILATAWNAHVFMLEMPIPTPRALSLTNFPSARVFTRTVKEISDGKFLTWREAAAKVFGDRDEELPNRETVVNRLAEELKMANEKPNLKFNMEKRMIAFELKFAPESAASHKLIGYFSSGSLHSPALILNLLTNIILTGLSPLVLNDTYQINLINSPLPRFLDNRFDQPCDMNCIIFAALISFALSMFLAALISFTVEERQNGMKQLQFMAGVHPMTYWFAQYVFDLLVMSIVSGIVVVIFMMDFKSKSNFREHDELLPLILAVSIFLCWSGLPWVYYLSNRTPLIFSGYVFTISLHLLLGIIPNIVIEEWYHEDKEVIYTKWFLHLFPPFTVTAAIYKWFHIVSVDRTCHKIPELLSQICNVTKEHSNLFEKELELQELHKYVVEHDVNLGKCCPRICEPSHTCYVFPELFSFKGESFRHLGLLGHILVLSVQGFLFWFILVLSEKKLPEHLMQKIIYRFLESHEKRQERIMKGKLTDSKSKLDVLAEKRRVTKSISQRNLPDDTALVCHDLTKSSATKMVVSNVNLEVRRGECVSLLGGAGCGKSCVMRMLTGEIIPTKGNVYIGKTNLLKNRKKYLNNIGYCPQTNCLFDEFTGVQMLQLMGRLKGVPRKLLTVHIDKWMRTLGLEEVRKDKCKSYSNTMKRLLCGAMALIGGKHIILLDEPTSEVDPLARQRFWAVIKHLTLKGHSVIFTSYNVEECTTLSTRILVLAEGNVQCVGTPLELEKRFSKGFSLLLKLRYEALTQIEIVSTTIGRVAELKKTVESKFKHVTLRDEQDNLLLYFLRDKTLTWGEAFRKGEEIMAHFEAILEKYFISQASLDDIFILLTNKYRELDKPRPMDANEAELNAHEEQDDNTKTERKSTTGKSAAVSDSQ